DEWERGFNVLGKNFIVRSKCLGMSGARDYHLEIDSEGYCVRNLPNRDSYREKISPIHRINLGVSIATLLTIGVVAYNACVNSCVSSDKIVRSSELENLE